ncbi:MAG: heparinase II/III-family protein [Candidatus Hydrogenedentes bacterium]|nr:heparinase II/III-family protein [Candidatus Hydrogenedentota bacterium]
MRKILLLSALLALSFVCRAEPVQPWSALLDKAASDASLDSARNELVEKARTLADMEIIRRPKTLAEVGTHRTWLDGRSKVLEDEIRENFALAMADFAACSTLAKELPLLAAAYRLTKDHSLRDRIVAQLEEMATWSPLQRPGWSLYVPGKRLPEDGKDGNWLATGCGIRALGNTLALLPEGTLEPELTKKITALLEIEIARVVDDWATERSWFIRGNNPVTNQWVLPTEGLVRACLMVGVEDHSDAYELGVKNLLMALDSHGKKGEFEEGLGYASFTVTSLLHTAYAMGVAGDRRAIDHPFLKNFSIWLVHHFQPGNMVVSCFDAGGAYGTAERSKPLLALLALCTGSRTARWALQEQVGGPPADLAGLAVSAMEPVGPESAPPLYANYERATRVNWRDSWDANGSGLWVRGGHSLDQHDHQDRGHVNFISRGRPILIEASTPSYHHPRMETHYSSGLGHNVLQLGTEFPDDIVEAGKFAPYPGWQIRKGIAPITVNRLDKRGGEVMVDGTACYEGLARWKRTVAWTADAVSISDDVLLADDKKDIILFRFHLGTETEVTIAAENDTQAFSHLVLCGSRGLGRSRNRPR